jgi:serine/threonine-protein kinase
LTLPGIGDLVDGRFRISRKLGEGGTSAVYEAIHTITDKKFAIKWLLPELASDEAAVDRFIHEARIAGKFAHPNAVQVFDICKANDSFYMLMELLEGESLQARLERLGRLSIRTACAIIMPCCDVLVAAHRAGIVHRDLKPANIFLCKPEVHAGVEQTKLLDFGISKFSSDQNLSLVNTATGSVIGTPLYMAPEQMLGEVADARTDIYAIGAVLFELVAGQPPYYADNYAELVVKATVECRPSAAGKLTELDPVFAAIVAKAMARNPGRRYASVAQLMQALRPYVEDVPIEAPAPEPSPAPSAAPTTLQAIEIARVEESLQQHSRLVFGRSRWQLATIGGLCVLGVLGWHALQPRTPMLDTGMVRPMSVSDAPRERDNGGNFGDSAARDDDADFNVFTGQALRDPLVTPQPSAAGSRGGNGGAHTRSKRSSSAHTVQREAATQSVTAPAPTTRANDDDAASLPSLRLQRDDFSSKARDRAAVRRDEQLAPAAEPSGPTPMPSASVSRHDF